MNRQATNPRHLIESAVVLKIVAATVHDHDYGSIVVGGEGCLT
jgi:hypothetical protein